MILPPLIMIPVILISIKLKIIPVEYSKLMSLVLIIESASPSAQVIIVSISQLGIPDIASNIAYIYVFLYVSSIFTITLWSTVGISLFY